MPTDALMTMAAYARRIGVSKEAVRQMVEGGRIPTKGGKIDPDEADEALLATTDQSKPRNVVSGHPGGRSKLGDPEANGGPSSPSGSFAAHRANREAIRVEREQLELAQIRGELVPKSDVKRETFELARRTRNQVMAVPAQVADEIAVEADPFKVRQLLEERLREALEGMRGGE